MNLADIAAKVSLQLDYRTGVVTRIRNHKKHYRILTSGYVCVVCIARVDDEASLCQRCEMTPLNHTIVPLVPDSAYYIRTKLRVKHIMLLMRCIFDFHNIIHGHDCNICLSHAVRTVRFSSRSVWICDVSLCITHLKNIVNDTADMAKRITLWMHVLRNYDDSKRVICSMLA